MPTDAQSFPLPVPSPGYRVSGKEVEVRDSGSRHHQLCGCCNLQLIQSHVALSHGPAARVLSPLSSWQSVSCCLSRMAKRSTPKPRGPLPFPSEPHGPLFTSEPCGLLLPSEPHGLLLQSVTPASIPVFFQLYWAAIVSLGRCGPMAWSQSSPRSHAGPVTRGSCFPVPSWVEVTPISLAQSRATAI